MSLKEEIEKEVAAIFRAAWTERDGNVVPTDESLKLGNDAISVDATVLYADMADSTQLVAGQTKAFAAEIYKTFLHCAAKIIRAEGGTITAYDGDRIMAVYIGDSKNTSAVQTALEIHYAVLHIVLPAMRAQYKTQTYVPQHVVGIDTSTLFVARTGVRGANDLVWVGRAANYAAKLSTMPHDYPTWITEEVYNRMRESVKVTNGQEMWEPRSWTAMNNKRIYRSNWYIPLT
ncbi:MAG: adenylate/guanylate cyclase domain-containing protein [Acidobacteriia bacterium]|nr:adenylate/guanylate cyclase domain-containing protein [Terriglobia bacterium]